MAREKRALVLPLISDEGCRWTPAMRGNFASKVLEIVTVQAQCLIKCHRAAADKMAYRL